MSEYDEGRRDARLEQLEEVQKHHESRLRLIERILWGLIGAFTLIQLVPTLQKIAGA